MHRHILQLLWLISVPVAVAAQATCPPSWVFEPVVKTNVNDRGTALVIEADGTEHLLYYSNDAGGGGELVYIHRSAGAPWSSGNSCVVGQDAFAGARLAVSPLHVPFATLSDGAAQTENLLVKPGSAWLSAAPSIPSGDFWKGGQGLAVAVTSQGVPCVAYFYGPPEDAYFAELVSGQWVTTVVETGDRVGKGMHIALTSDDRPVLEYYDQDTDTVHVAERSSNGTWSIAVLPLVHDPMDLAIGPADEPWALTRGSNQSFPLRLLVKQGGVYTIDTTFPGAAYDVGALTVDDAGKPHVVGSNWMTGQVDCLVKSGGAWMVYPVASGSTGGRIADIALRPDGANVISYVRIADDTVMTATEQGCVWMDLGQGLPGSMGQPYLTGTGTLQPGTPMALHLASAKPLTIARLVVGASEIDAPFKGGVLVPHPDLVLVTLVDGFGNIELPATWPAGVPSGAVIYFQWWITDASGPMGYTASNGLKATAP